MTKLLSAARAVCRLAALLAVIVGSMADYAMRGRNRRDLAGRARWLQRSCARALRAIGVRVAARGEAAQGAVIVANHVSYLDILVLAALTPVVFVSKKEVRSWPVFGWFAEKAGTRFIDRTRRGDVARIGAELGPVLAADLAIVIFLEGTTSDGRQVLPFKPSLLEPALQQGWRVVPAALRYAVPPERSVEQEVAWWGDMTLPPHLLNFASLPWVQADVAWGEAEPAGAGDRKEFAARLHQRVVALLEDRAASGPREREKGAAARTTRPA